MSKNKAVLRISVILALVIISCMIAGCLNFQPDTVSVKTTPAPVTTIPALTVQTTSGTPVVQTTTTVQKTTGISTITQLSSATPSVSMTSVATTEKFVSGSDIAIKNRDFYPAVIFINPGTTVTFTNMDTVPHLIASDTGAPASFKTDTIPPGGSYKITLTQSGTYSYHCTLTSGPPGTIMVN